ncbi:MAG: glycosyltransferase family 2 protein [Bacteroidetes bacterium]|nr:glycosyltransferase family 2 protein [Bacteroidota bacterium]
MMVSVIMCAYNVEAFIDEAMQCILRQTYTNWELIICDDKSTDNTIQIVERYISDKRIRLIKNDTNVGYVANKNRAFTYARGELLTQLDADDCCPADRIQKQVAVFENNPQIVICGGNFNTIDTTGNILNENVCDKDALIEKPMLDYPFWFPGLMFRKEVFESFGAFSEYFNGIYGDDHYWTMRVNKQYPIYFLKNVIYNYRINPNSLTNVYDKPRKLIAQDIIAELYRQITETGTDWLSEGHPEKMQQFEKELFMNKELMAKRYRVWAAKAIDKHNWQQAKALLKKCLQTGRAGFTGYRTLLYYIKSRYLRPSIKN